MPKFPFSALATHLLVSSSTALSLSLCNGRCNRDHITKLVFCFFFISTLFFYLLFFFLRCRFVLWVLSLGVRKISQISIYVIFFIRRRFARPFALKDCRRYHFLSFLFYFIYLILDVCCASSTFPALLFICIYIFLLII